jgi:hypothetical protein
MENEGIVGNSNTVAIKSEIVRQLARLEETTPENLERAVFYALTGHSKEEVDWTIEDNQAGEFLWVKAFDQLLSELSQDGYVRVEDRDGESVLVAAEQETPSEYSQVGPSSRSH